MLVNMGPGLNNKGRQEGLLSCVDCIVYLKDDIAVPWPVLVTW